MNVKESVLKTIAGSGESYVSGAQIASAIGVSRNAVWKAVRSLKGEGFLIDAVSSRGYRISAENNKLSSDIITAGLTTSCIGKNITVLDKTKSTNNDAKELAAAGAPEGTVVIADSQTTGRGRQGRSFFSPPGNGIYMSVIIRPSVGVEAAQLITSCTACAAAATVEELCGHEVAVKWVNDLYMNSRKICGILTEASLSLENRSLDYAVIGIGINVFSTKGIFSSELERTATSVEDETGIRVNRNRLCSVLLNKLEEYLGEIGSRAFLDEYRRRELLTGHIVTVNVSGEILTGKAVGIDDAAALILELPDGTKRTVSSGEACLCRIKKD